ncbi:pyridoxamine 5'-phosphate oxidase family protein [Phytohabitans sp. LJ34]|uniref:pyridoxamine 5'-phosphate oxidase family protein n=1 Tax=Phytohabitans sp. LJ34 TaxID=3452217 RepID=UPI003F8ACB67
MADAAEVYRARPTDAEIAEVLSQRAVAALGTLNADGSIHLTYVIFLHHEGRVYFETSSVTRKARNAERTGRASVLVQGHASSGRSLMVSFEGTARVIRGPGAQELNHRLRAKYIKPDALADVDRAWGRLDDVAIEITPTARRAWSGSALHEETQRELSVPYGEIWLGD